MDLSQIHNQDYLRSLVQATIQRPVENANVSTS
jgi:hypothetical protein